MHIEIFPAQKTCEQGCFACPLAKRDSVSIETAIDGHVQETYSHLERVLSETGNRYDLHFPSRQELFPEVRFPRSVRKLRLETGRAISKEGNALVFSEGIRDIVRQRSLAPTTIGFSLVPEYPVLSLDDAHIARSIVQALSLWHIPGARQTATIEVTMRSNLIPVALFEKVAPELEAGDVLYLKSFMPGVEMIPEHTGRELFHTFSGSALYFNEYTGKIRGRKFVASNRVISYAKPVEKKEAYVKQARTLYPRALHYLDFLIDPKGVMLMHTSSAINNPILWVSHGDFRRTIGRIRRDSLYSILLMAQNMIIQNMVMYEVAQDAGVPNAAVPHFFETYRQKMVQPKTKPRQYY